jgi:hypothetical protein
MKLEFSRHIFEKYSNFEFHGNLPLGAEFFHADGWTDGLVHGYTDRGTNGQTDITKLIVGLRNFVKEFKRRKPYYKILIIFVPVAAANLNICYEKLFANRRHITFC